MVRKNSSSLLRHPVALAVCTVALGIIAWGTLTTARPDRSATPSWCFLCAEVHGTDVLLNVLLFIPLGVGLRVAGASHRRVLGVSAVVTLAVELAQWFLVTGRIASVADMVANLLGAATGILLASHGRKLILPEAPLARLLAAASITGWLVVQALTVWAFAPSLKGDAFWGQIAADLGHMHRFTGRVIAARIGDTSVPDGRIKDVKPVRRLFAKGAAVEALVVPGEPPAQVAPIVSIFNGEQQEIMVLGQEGQDLVFRMRTHAASARLRIPTVSLWGAFPSLARPEDGPPRDTIRISGWRSGWRMYASATSRDTSTSRSIALRPTFGWALILPFEHTLTPRSWRFTAAWMAVLLFPAGYWGARCLIPVPNTAVRQSALSVVFRVLTMLVIAAIMLVAGLIGLPWRLGLATAGVWEWGGAMAGIAFGTIVGLLSYLISHSRLRRSPE